MTPFEFLGVAEDADERAVKSAYARRLRETRPDRDPVGFQQLHAAYKAALQIGQARGSGMRRPLPPVAVVEQASASDALEEEEGEEENAPSTPEFTRRIRTTPRQLVAPAPVPQRFDFEQFLSRLQALVRDVGAAELLPWLQSEPAFWSLELKAGVRQVLLQRLDAQRVPMPVECFDALLAFFDLDHVLAGVDAFAVQRLRRQLHLQWELLPAKFAQLSARMRRDPPAVRGETELRQLLDEARRPLTWGALLHWAGQPQHAVRFAVFTQRLSYGEPAELPAPFNQQAIRFWTEAARTLDPTWRTLGMAALHALAWSLVGIAMVVVAAIKWPPEDRGVAFVFGGIEILLCIVYVGGIAWRGLLRWLSLREHSSGPAWRYWLRLGFIPALALSGATLGTFVHPLAGAGESLLALALAYGCVITLSKQRFGVGGVLISYLMLAGIGMSLSIEYGCLITAAVAVGFWILFCYKKLLYRRF